MPYPIRFLTLVSLTLALQACATTPHVGVRNGFESRQIREIAIAPIWSTSHFGTSPAEWRRLESETIRDVTAELTELGFRTVDPAGLRDQLERRRAWPRFVDILEFGESLDNRFEPSLYSPPTAEVDTLRELAAEGAIEAPTILFIEIVYESRGTCSVDSTEFNRFAVVVNRDGQPIEAPGTTACVVTHIQAKLVDSRTASTMWHNRLLRELRVTEVTADDELLNVRQTAREVVAGSYGLAPFAPHRMQPR